MDKKLHETTNLCEEIMNSKRQVKGKLGWWYKFAFAVWRKREAFKSLYHTNKGPYRVDYEFDVE